MPRYSCVRTVSTAVERASEAWRRRRKACAPVEDTSRSSRRRRGVRAGLTVGAEGAGAGMGVVCEVGLREWIGGSVVDCGAGGSVVPVVVVVLLAEDMVWYCLVG